MKRGRVFAAALVVTAALGGCSAMRSGPMRAEGTASEPPAQAGRYSKQAVPDAVMLPDQAGSFYRDTPAP